MDSTDVPTPPDPAAFPIRLTDTRQPPAGEDGFQEAPTIVPAERAPTPAGPPTVPGYEILGELGRGGMGVVYKARQVALNRLVALKVVIGAGHGGEELLARFKTEAEALARLSHPNLVQVFDYGQHDGLPYFALEYLEGGSLDRYLGGRVQPPREAAALVETLARAMHAVHAAGLIHRDLKPANVLLADSGQQTAVSKNQAGVSSPTADRCLLTAKITDFGLVKSLEGDGNQTKTGVVMGTPNYMAPEQASGQRTVGPAADVWALGAILYECLTGRPPFRGGTSMDTVLQVLSSEPLAPTLLEPRTPRDLETVCLKCLQKDPWKRYGTAEALADDLRRYLAGEPIQARPVGPAERAWRWCRRNPGTATAIGTTAAALLLGAVVAGFFAVRANRNALEAEANAARAEANEGLARQALDLALLQALELEAGPGACDPGRLAAFVKGGPQADLPWEWRYWDQVVNRLPRAVLIPPGTVVAALTADARRAALARVVDRKGAVQFFDSAPGLQREFGSVPGRPVAVAVSRDGRVVAALGTAADQGAQVLGQILGGRYPPPPAALRAWDTVAGREVLADANLIGDVLAVSPGGERVAAVARQEIRLWDLTTGRPLPGLPVAGAAVTALGFRPDGRHLAVGLKDPPRVQVWDLATAQVDNEPDGVPGVPRCLAYRPDGQGLACGTAAGLARYWPLAGGKSPGRSLVGHSGLVRALAFTADGKHLLTAGGDHTVRRWDPERAVELTAYRGLEGEVQALAFTADGRQIVAVDVKDDHHPQGGTAWVRRWDTAEAPDRIAWEPGLPICTGARFSPDGRTLASPGTAGSIPLAMTGTLRLWDVATRQSVRDLAPHGLLMTAVAFHPNGAQMVTGAQEGQLWAPRGSVKIWDVATGEGRLLAPAFGAPVLTVAYSPDGTLVAAGCGLPGEARSDELIVWDAATGAVRGRFQPGSSVSGLAFRPDGSQLAVGCGVHGKTTVVLLDTATWQETARLPAMGLPVFRPAYSPDGRRLAFGCFDRTARVWDLAAARMTVLPGHAAIVTGVAWSPDGRRLATTVTDFRPRGVGGVKVWDVEKQQAVVNLPDGMIDVAFSPDGRYLGAVGGTLEVPRLLLWDAGRQGR
jgi:WD40 repeat protein